MTQTMMRDAAISFPMFGNFSIDPSPYFTVFGRNIYWYGVILATAFLVTLLYCAHRSKDFGIKSDDVYEEVLWLIPLGVIGCRIYYVVFEWEYYSQHLNEIIRVWDGGVAMYGGIIAGFIFLLIWTKKKKLPLGAILDVDASGMLLAHSIGRWGNFMNREAFGGETDIFCRMGLTNPGTETIYVHPTFLYESLWTLAGFFLLNLWSRKGRRKFDGQMFMLYIMWYGMGRAWIEGLRTDSLWLIPGVIRVSQLVAILTALIMAAVLIIQSRRPHPPEKMYVNRAAADEAPHADNISETNETGQAAETEKEAENEQSNKEEQ